MIQLAGTHPLLPSVAVLDVNGVGYELGISASTAAALHKQVKQALLFLTRMVVREDSMELARLLRERKACALVAYVR